MVIFLVRSRRVGLEILFGVKYRDDNFIFVVSG